MNNKKILIIEDDKILLDILMKKLKQSDYIVTGAEDGEVGIKKVKAEKPDLVLLDILMPNKDGFEVMEAKNKDKEVKDIPVVVISNSGQPIEIERAKKLGAKDFLVKAIFDPNEVLEKVRKILKEEPKSKNEEKKVKSDAGANSQDRSTVSNDTKTIEKDDKGNAGKDNKKANRHIKVLVVEDDEFLRQLVSRKLGDEGFDVKVAIDAEGAFKILKEIKPDIILLDLILPGLDGFQILSKMKKDKSITSIPVIILSNLGQKEDIDKAMALGAADFLVKAYFTLDEIVKKIESVLGKK